MADTQQLRPHDPDRLVRKPPELGPNPVAILCEGSPERLRTVSTSWAGLVMYWGQPAAVVLSRTSRYVREFCQRNKRVTMSVLRGSSLPELRAGNSPRGVMPQTPISSVRATMLGGHVALEGSEMVLRCKLAYASELSEELREQLAPTKVDLKELGRQTVIIAYVEEAWTR